MLLPFHDSSNFISIHISLLLFFKVITCRWPIIQHAFIFPQRFNGADIKIGGLIYEGVPFRSIRYPRLLHSDHVVERVSFLSSLFVHTRVLFKILLQFHNLSLVLFLHMIELSLIFLVSSFFASLSHLVDQQSVSQSFILSLQSHHLIIFLFAFLMDTILFLTNFSIVVLFHLLQSILKLSFELWFVILTQSFYRWLKLVQNISIIIFSTLYFTLKVVYFCCIRLLLLLTFTWHLHDFLLCTAQFVPKSFDILIEATCLRIVRWSELLYGSVLGLSFIKITLLKFSPFLYKVLYFFPENCLIFIHLWFH